MGEQRGTDGQHVNSATGAQHLRRRGLIAGAAALAAGLLARQAAEPVAALNPPFLLGQDNVPPTTNVATSITAYANFGFGTTTLFYANASPSGNDINGAGAAGSGQGAGVTGIGGTHGGAGVIGTGGTAGGGLGTGSGVVGVAHGATPPAAGLGVGVYGVGVAFGVAGSAQIGVYGTGTQFGVQGSGDNVAVAGRGTGSTGSGVAGIATGSAPVTLAPRVVGVYAGAIGTQKNALLAETDAPTLPAIRAINNGYPAASLFDTGDGIQGYTTGATNAGVLGANTTNGGVGVQGLGAGPVGIGVRGVAAAGFGVYGTTNGTGLVAGLYGTSTTAYGIIGNTTAPFYSGLTATTATANCAALAATSTNASAFAAYFSGFTYVQGDFAVSGNKSAAVMHPDGTRRLLYCVESPEAWFEDFGTAKLVGGKADVKIDPEFAALVHGDDYHVFLTERDGHHHLAATNLTPGGFSVEADAEMAALKGKKAADGAGSFSWRVVAKRKDSTGKRLEKLHVPKFILPDPAQLPKPPLVPTKP